MWDSLVHKKEWIADVSTVEKGITDIKGDTACYPIYVYQKITRNENIYIQ